MTNQMMDFSKVMEVIQNPLLYIDKFMSIPDKDGISVPFHLNKVQKIVLETLLKYHRIIIVKARQMGCSTGISGFFLATCETKPNTVAIVVSHEEFATQRLLDKVKFFEKSIPDECKFPLHHKSTYEMSWEELNCSFYIGSARATTIARGDIIHLCHLSEPAFYPTDRAEALMAGVTEAVPMSGYLALESTPNGRAGKFYETYQAAKAGENSFTPLFFPWWFDDGYRVPEGSMLVKESIRFHIDPSEEESILMTEHNLDIDQIRWRRHKQGDLQELFKQEYPENDIDCWLVRGTSVFPVDVLMDMAARARKPFFEAEGVRKWRNPAGGTKYLMVIDAAKGLPTSDPSVAIILNVSNCSHEATLRGRYPTDILATKAAQLGRQYNNALAVVEREGYGDAVIKFLEREGYPHIYKHHDNKSGWPMVAKGSFNRRTCIQELSTNLRIRLLQSYDEVFIGEALDFQYLDGKEQAPPGGHDDTVMSMAIGMAMLKQPIFMLEEANVPSVSYAQGLV